MTAPHDTPRTDERAGLSEAERDSLWAGIRRARHEDAPISLAHESNRAHVLWAITPAVERIIADRLAAAVARAETAEAAVERVLGECEYADDYGAADQDDERWVEVRVIRAALADVPTSAPTGEAP